MQSITLHEQAHLLRVDNQKSVHWLSVPAYSVGRATSLAAKKAGFSLVVTGQGGGRGLIPLITGDLYPADGKLLWLSANSISFDLQAQLASNQFTVERLTAYKMPKVKSSDIQLLGKLMACKAAAAVVMSARSMSFFRGLLDSSGCASYRSKVSLILGSSNIAKTAGSGWDQIIVARSPRRSRLLAIATLLHRQSSAHGHDN